VPTALDPSTQTKLDNLRGLNGQDFTKQYLDDQVGAHKDAVSLFQRYGKSGDNTTLKSWATETLPTLQHRAAYFVGAFVLLSSLTYANLGPIRSAIACCMSECWALDASR
jgi:predicted outer membrane protein